MNQSLIILLSSALSVGLIHTLLGPDHYLPFIVLARTRNWSMLKTIVITLCCGIGHILSGVLLGLGVISIGIIAKNLHLIESLRGEVAAWLLIGFGFAYFIWGIRYAINKRRHSHNHAHEDGHTHEHTHSHLLGHAHIHSEGKKGELTPWVLFIIFILGPCEPLIPLIVYPAIQDSKMDVFLVSLVFGLATIFVMLSVVIASLLGLKQMKFRFFEKYGNMAAGATICCSGLAIKFLGL